jgi:MoaA/NifB/PqqE/SkfB family radical SAM enzyme
MRLESRWRRTQASFVTESANKPGDDRVSHWNCKKQRLAATGLFQQKLRGGSRARAFAHTGDPLASDPFCPYEPKVTASSGQAS